METRSLTKRFGTVLANDAIDFKVGKGEIYALLGENGAGKSTLMNMLSGVYTPDSGQILIHSSPVQFRSPGDAIRMGIGMIYQHFKLIDVMTALENIMLGTGSSALLNKSSALLRVREICGKYGLSFNPDKKVYDMSVGEKQTVEIVKVLFRGADILILDEPTAVLTPQETANLFTILKKMKDDGCAVVIITHKLNEVMEISDKVTVLRKGRNVGTVNTSDTDPKKLTDLMVGTSLDLSIDYYETKGKNIDLSVGSLTVYDDQNIKKLDAVSFDLHSGEILGVAGVADSGQKELCEALAGLQTIKSGSVRFKGTELVGLTSRQIIEKGISMSFIPEDRLGMGLVASMDITSNIMLKDYYRTPGPFLDRAGGRIKAERIIEKFDIRTPGPDHPVKLLSGGNIQKVLLGREIESSPHLLITAYPTRGLDIASSHLIYDQLNVQKRLGVPILYIGEDLDVLLELCDRILVLCDGRCMGILNSGNATKEAIGLMMAGHESALSDKAAT